MLRIEEPAPNDDDEQDDAPHPMEGNLWMIQCKREKELGPKRVEAIIKGSVMPTQHLALRIYLGSTSEFLESRARPV